MSQANPSSSLRFLKWFDEAQKKKYRSNTLTPFLGVAALSAHSDFRIFLKEDIFISTEELIKDLTEIEYLQNRHMLNLALADYQRASVTDIAYIMLDRVHAPENIPSAIKEHIAIFLERHSHSINNLLAEYCLEIMDSGFYYINYSSK